MRTNAIIRIIIWSLVIVLLISILTIGLDRPRRRLSDRIPMATEIPAETAPAVPVEETWTPLEATVTATAVNIRSAPNSDSSPVGMLEQNDTVVITRQENVDGTAWVYITQPSSGWVKAEYLRMESESSAASSYGISLDPRQIREIDIEWAAGHITIEPANVDALEISESSVSQSKYAMVWNQHNDKLSIRFCENASLSFGFGNIDMVSKDLTILVPMGWELDSLEIDAAYAALDVKNLVIRKMDFDGASGTCNFDNCAIGDLDLDTASGDIYFTGTLEVLDCDAASASVFAVFDNVPRSIDMDSMSGDLDITLPSSAGFTVSMDALSSDFTSDFGYSKKNGNYYRGDGKCKITLDAMSGDLYIRESKEADVLPESTATP